jgi:hypothetical protein
MVISVTEDQDDGGMLEVTDTDQLTGPERWLYERLNPFRAWLLMRGFTILLIVAFIWAGLELNAFQDQAQAYADLLREEGCRALPDSHKLQPDPNPGLNITNLTRNGSGPR